MTKQWNELKSTITELRDNGGSGTQQEICKFLVNLMGVLEKQMQEPCEDCISRQAAIDEMRKCRFVVDAIAKIKELLSAQLEQRWILCSERLPESMVPVPTLDGRCFTVEQRIPDVYDTGWNESCWWVGGAWMLLPKPYRGDKK